MTLKRKLELPEVQQDFRLSKFRALASKTHPVVLERYVPEQSNDFYLRL